MQHTHRTTLAGNLHEAHVAATLTVTTGQVVQPNVALGLVGRRAVSGGAAW